jgi:hypothetical protein
MLGDRGFEVSRNLSFDVLRFQDFEVFRISRF